ncbi:MAG: DUF192 domain-containing protein [Ignavibacteriales bacterium]|nr:DUF192 domain-containing protein [Ignavibacteriales bacterium]
MNKQDTPSKTTKKNSRSKSILIYGTIILIIAGFLAMLIIPPLMEKPKTSSTAEDKGNGFSKEGSAEFVTSDNRVYAIDIELARTEDEQALGLMFRERMETNQGMLFIFPVQDYRSFWMKNTVISLDMLFITDSLKIATIHKGTIPFAEKSYASSEPVKYVIEVNAGYCDQNNIKVGDKVKLFY